MTQTRIHYRQDDVERLLKAKLTNTEIGKRLRMDRHMVGRIRRHLGYPDVPRKRKSSPSLAELFTANTTELPGGHLLWTGRRVADCTPVLKHEGRDYTVRRVAYFLEHGCWPEGHVQPECGQRFCVAPGHCDDFRSRQQIREALRCLRNMPERPAECVHGHDQAEHGRLGPDGSAYCGRCTTMRKAAG